jgi:hypothetical protein
MICASLLPKTLIFRGLDAQQPKPFEREMTLPRGLSRRRIDSRRAARAHCIDHQYAESPGFRLSPAPMHAIKQALRLVTE